jgi:hypothetical protein
VEEGLLRCHSEEVDVDVALDCDCGCGIAGHDVGDCCLEVCCELWVVAWSSVDVDDGVDWAGFLFVGVDL